MPSTTSSDIISQIQAYSKERKELQNTLSFDAEKYLSLFNRLDNIKDSNKELPDRQKQLEELQKDFDGFEKQNQVNKSDYDKKMKDIQQRELTYINSNLSKDTDINTIIDVLKSGLLDYKYAVNLIKNNNDIRQKIRDGKYVIARKGNRVALIATDEKIIGYKQELTNFLQSQDNKDINNIVLSNVPVYNNGSHVLSFDKDKQDLSDDVLKIYFSVEDDKNISWFQDSKMAKLHSDIVKDVSKQLIEYCQSCGLGSKINVQTECSSDGIAPLLTGFLSAKQDDLKHYLLLCNSSISMSLTPRRALNGFKPEAIAKTVYELFQIAILNGYNAKNPDTAFVNLDMSSNDGSFEYHNIGSTNSFLKELGRLQAEHNRDCVDADKQTLLVAINDNIISATGDNKNLQSKKNTWFTGIKHQDILNNIRDNKDFYDGIQVRAMSDLADEINRKNTMQNNTAGISKNNKDGVLHTVNSDKTVNNGFAKSQAIEDKTVKKI